MLWLIAAYFNKDAFTEDNPVFNKLAPDLFLFVCLRQCTIYATIIDRCLFNALIMQFTLLAYFLNYNYNLIKAVKSGHQNHRIVKDQVRMSLISLPSMAEFFMN